MKKMIAMGILIAAAVWGWIQYSGGNVPAKSKPATTAQQPSTETTKAKTSDTISADALPAAAVLRINPRASSAVAAPVVPAVAASPAVAAYMSNKGLPALYAQLLQRDDGESAALRARLLERCAKKIDADPNKKPPPSREERRAKFMASLPENSPERDARIRSYDEANEDTCGELSALTTTKAEIAALEATALAAKETSAAVKKVDCEMQASAKQLGDQRKNGTTMTEAQLQQLTDVIATKNPLTLGPALGLLSNTLANGKILWRDTGAPLEESIGMKLARTLPCEYGQDCSRELKQLCAQRGRCAASTLADHIAYYELSPYEAQQLELYRQRFTQMIGSGNFSALKLSLSEEGNQNSVYRASYNSCE